MKLPLFLRRLFPVATGYHRTLAANKARRDRRLRRIGLVGRNHWFASDLRGRKNRQRKLYD